MYRGLLHLLHLTCADSFEKPLKVQFLLFHFLKSLIRYLENCVINDIVFERTNLVVVEN